MNESQSATTRSPLSQPVQFIRGVGPKRAELLNRLDLRTAADLLFFFPRDYQDFTELTAIADLTDGQLVSIVGQVCDLDQQRSAAGRHVTYVLVEQHAGDEKSYLRAVWFNQGYLVNRFQIGQRVMLQGKVKLQHGSAQMTHPRTTWLDQETDSSDAVSRGELLPVYRLTEGLNQRQIREVVANAVAEFAHLVEEAMPQELRKEAGVCGIRQAIEQIHAPRSREQIEHARRRLVYQELLILQLALAIRRHRVQHSCVAPQLELTPKIRSRILKRFPFDLTESQAQALDEIAADMNRPFPMNRLLQGEVGSGKTAIAVCAMLLSIAHGYQAILMAPTEILARQHFQTLTRMLKGSRVRLGLVTGSQKPSVRKKTAAAIESGEIDLVVGTQTLVGRSTRFHQLGLVVIDEQHKFGVRQRASLKQTEHDPHYLVMTATPIPRTVSMTLFGDLDVSTLQKPDGVGNLVHSYLGQQASRDQWWDFFRKKLEQGRQGYVVAPLVDSSDDSGLSSAERLFESLANGPLEPFRIDLIHGRQSGDEKEAAMAKFAAGKTQVLVATGVIEVGINVPNATVMTIESAERFGLSQLHQLRGRISRGKHPGYVCAFTSSDEPELNQRLKAFEETNDGFKLAEIDLQIRGPGNLFSSQQSGFPPLMIADLIRDGEVLATAQQDARRLIEQDPGLSLPEHSRLNQLVFARYGRALDLADVG